MIKNILNWCMNNLWKLVLFGFWIVFVAWEFNRLGTIQPSYIVTYKFIIICPIIFGFMLYGVYSFIKNFSEYL